MTASKKSEDKPNSNSQTPSALAGLRVIDISRLVAGNMLSLQLADFGADVIKVEPLPAGDTLRSWKDDGHAFYWKVYGRNKRSLALNFRQSGSIELLTRLISKADILLESFRPGTLEKMQLGPETLIEKFPQLIVVRISGYGQAGPYSHRPGFGTLMEAMSGFASRNGFADREPVLPPMPLADMISGLYGAYATMVALRNRDQSDGRGQIIDLSLMQSMMSVLSADVAINQSTGEIKPRLGSGSNQAGPRGVYRTKDEKWVAISASTQNSAMRFLELIGGEELTRDPRFLENAGRVKNRTELDQLINNWMGEKTREEALEIVDQAGVTAGPVYDASEILDDPHVQDTNVFFPSPDPEIGTLYSHSPTPKLSRSPGKVEMSAPSLGQNTEEILREAGFSDTEIGHFIQSGLVGV